MLASDLSGTSETTYLGVSAENSGLLDDWADLVVCRNALDHMLSPEAALEEISRILKKDGRLYLSVDIGGAPTPDEPTAFSEKQLTKVLVKHFTTLRSTRIARPFSGARDYSLRILARKKFRGERKLNKAEILESYMREFGAEEWPLEQLRG
jgi:ubiquinone/menaquinone biosynthesis C-methylase UbiE